MRERNFADTAARLTPAGRGMRRLARVTLAGALLLPLLAACGEEEVAQEPAATPPATAEAPAGTTTTTTPPAAGTATSGSSGTTAAPAGVPKAIESTDRAIQAVPPAEPGKQ